MKKTAAEIVREYGPFPGSAKIAGVTFDGRHVWFADGESWSSSALALALGASQRTVQRSLDALAESGKVQSVGCGRARRWMTPPVPGFATTLLLPAPLPGD
ncbi:MAG TPA: hypothetical protein VFP36_03725 [Usitatibacter sp.]|nr:hypothetical protein [Usitatibacter sp.]